MARILVVEDDGALRLDMVDTVKSWGHHVMSASNGQDGFDIIERWYPDLILTDINMPVANGFELVQKLAGTDNRHAGAAIILISSLESQDVKMKGIDIGADDYIAKPLHYGFLKSKIDAHLRKRGNLLQLFQSERLARSGMEGITFAAMCVCAAFPLGVVALLLIYWIKVVLGIDVFQDVHLGDLIGR